MRELITEEKYEEFLQRANYDLKAVRDENDVNLRKSIKGFCKAQQEKFDEGKLTGCCLNFSIFLLSRYQGLLLTCKDGPRGVHCAFLYPDQNGKLFVCDPARAKIENNGNNYFRVPLKEYSFPNDGPQVYRIFTGMNPNDDQHTFFEVFIDKNAQLVFKDDLSGSDGVSIGESNTRLF